MTTNCTNTANPVAIAQGGTGATSKAAAFTALAPTPSAIGDILYSSDGVTWVKLAAPTVTGTHVLTSVVVGGIVTSFGWV